MFSVVDYKAVPISEFKAKCLALIDEMNASGECIIVTRHGHPVARVAPPDLAAGGICGLYADATLEIQQDDLGYTEAEWEEEMAAWDATQSWWQPKADSATRTSGPDAP